MREQSDSFFLHEFLDDFVQPVYLHEFVAKAAGHKLRYFADARIPPMYTAGLSSEAIQLLREMAPDPIRAEQYLDFLRRRSFRRSLLCHGNLNPSPVPLPERLTPQQLSKLQAMKLGE
jgi:hypothetical protein